MAISKTTDIEKGIVTSSGSSIIGDMAASAINGSDRTQRRLKARHIQLIG